MAKDNLCWFDVEDRTGLPCERMPFKPMEPNLQACAVCQAAIMNDLLQELIENGLTVEHQHYMVAKEGKPAEPQRKAQVAPKTP